MKILCGFLVPAIVQVDFPEIKVFAETVTGLIYLVGLTMSTVCIAWVAFLLMLSGSNSNKLLSARIALMGIALGIILLIGAPRVSEVMQSLSPFPTPTPILIPTRVPR